MDDGQTLGRAEALLELGRAREAESILLHLLAADPQDPDVIYALSRAVQAQERFAEARDLAQRGLHGSPEHLGLLLVLSSAHAGLEDFGSALQAVRSAVQIAPEHPSVHQQEGALLLAEDKPQEALAAFGRAEQLDPDNSHTAALRAAAHFNLRNVVEAEYEVARALRLDPNNADAHRIRGMLALTRGGGTAAVEAHRSALHLDPTDAYHREGMATALKSRNPLYGLLIRYGYWLNGLSDGVRWILLLAPLFVVKLLRPVADQPWAIVVIGVVITFVALSWLLEPVQNTILLCGAYSRNLLSPLARKATYAFLANVSAGAALAIAGAASGRELFVVLGIAFVIWSVTAGQVHLIEAGRLKLAVMLHCGGAALGLASAGLVAAGVTGFASLAGVYFVAGVAMLWFTTLA